MMCLTTLPEMPRNVNGKDHCLQILVFMRTKAPFVIYAPMTEMPYFFITQLPGEASRFVVSLKGYSKSGQVFYCLFHFV